MTGYPVTQSDLTLLHAMSALQPAQNSLGQKTWVVVRFVLFGFGGFWAMLGFLVVFALRVWDHDENMMSAWLSLPLAFAGALMMLFGVGEWGRWAYLGVFISIPIALGLMSVIPGIGDDLGIPLTVVAIVAFASSRAVRAYYARQEE